RVSSTTDTAMGDILIERHFFLNRGPFYYCSFGLLLGRFFFLLFKESSALLFLFSFFLLDSFFYCSVAFFENEFCKAGVNFCHYKFFCCFSTVDEWLQRYFYWA